jgi:hypothetical protein
MDWNRGAVCADAIGRGAALAAKFTIMRGQFDQVKHRFSQINGTDYTKKNERARCEHIH